MTQDAEMKKVLIAFLGNASYKETTYLLDECSYRRNLAFLPIYERFSPFETTYVIGTKDSKWDLLKDFPHIPVKIPYGRSEDEFWDIFDILTSSVELKEREVIFDVTHCFRTIPVFVAIYIRLLKYKEPTAHLTHIFYGSYMPWEEVTPIIDFAPLIGLLDWLEAVSSFSKYGELEELAGMVSASSKKAWQGIGNQRPQKLSEFSQKLSKLSEASRLTYIPVFFELNEDLSNLLHEPQLESELKQFAKPFSLLFQKFKDHAERFRQKSQWRAQVEIAAWYFESKKFAQALSVLREAIITFECEKKGCELLGVERRESIAKQLSRQIRRSNKPLIKLWGRVTEERNRVAHALMSGRDKTISPMRRGPIIKRLIGETQKLLGDLE